MWFLQPEDAPTMTPGKRDKQYREVGPGLLSGSYKFRNAERSFSVPEMETTGLFMPLQTEK